MVNMDAPQPKGLPRGCDSVEILGKIAPGARCPYPCDANWIRCARRINPAPPRTSAPAGGSIGSESIGGRKRSTSALFTMDKNCLAHANTVAYPAQKERNARAVRFRPHTRAMAA